MNSVDATPFYRELPTMVRQQIPTLTAEQRAAFLDEYRRRRKSGWWAWGLWLAFGWHYAYFGRWGRQFVILFVYAITLGVWWIVEGFLMPRRLRDQRSEAAIGALRDLRLVKEQAATYAPV